MGAQGVRNDVAQRRVEVEGALLETNRCKELRGFEHLQKMVESSQKKCALEVICRGDKVN
jgi:hypothetical protein